MKDHTNWADVVGKTTEDIASIKRNIHDGVISPKMARQLASECLRLANEVLWASTEAR